MNEGGNHDVCPTAVSVAIIEPVGRHGGMHYYDIGLCSGLLAAECRVSLYTCDETPDPGIPGLAFYPVFREIYTYQSLFLKALRYLVGTFTSLFNALRSHEKVCHLHAFNDLTAELLVLALTKLFRRKIVLTVHDVDSLARHVAGKRIATACIYRLADRIIVHNNVSMLELIALGIPSGRLTVLPHGHFLQSTRTLPPQSAARRRLRIDERAKVLLFFGQIKEAKGLDLLIQALPQVALAHPHVLLLIAGRPWKTDLVQYDALIDRLNVRSRCLMQIGFIPEDEVAGYYAAADVIVLPYRRIYQSGVLLMAMTYAKPVVVSNLPGMTGIITDGVNGYVFEQGSKDDLARVLTQVLKDDSGRQLVSSRAFQFISQHHDWNRIGQRTASLYREVLKQ
jgi:D-inositol-3-phosphate glycosyltransferase